jgi:4-amino-4-deoxy-L-arabinose transferase-like glycosyltransferase
MLGLRDLIAEVAKDNHPPLYYLMLSLWIKLAGISELAVRSFSMLCYTAGIFIVYYISKIFYKSRTAAIFTAVLYASALVTIAHSTNARMYSMLSVLEMASILYFTEFFVSKTGGRKQLIFLALVNTAGVFTHYWFLFVILSQAVFAVIVYRNRIKEVVFSVFLPVFLLLFAWSRVFLYQAGNKSMSFIKYREGLIEETMNNFYYGWSWVLYIAVFISIIAGIIKRISKDEDKKKNTLFKEAKIFFKDETNQFLAFLLAVILLLPVLVTKYLVPVYVVGRYTIVTFIPFVILFGGLSYKFAERRLLWFSFFIFALVYILPWFWAYKGSYIYSDKWKIEIVMKKAQDGDIIMFSGLGRVGADYYLKRLKSNLRLTEFSFPSEIDTVHPCWSYLEVIDEKNSAELEIKIADINSVMRKNNAWLWVFWDYKMEINDEIRDRLKQVFHEKVMIRHRLGRYILSVYEKKQ